MNVGPRDGRTPLERPAPSTPASPFSQAPFIVIWETTRACALKCIHCRADAIAHRDPDELSTDEGKRLIDRVAAFGNPPPILVLTGGDPLRRPDVTELVAHGTEMGVSVSLTPSGTAAVTRDKLRRLQDAGLARLAVSLDGATEEAHDAFRGVRGSHRYTVRIIEHAHALGLPLQINTTVCRSTVGQLEALAPQIAEIQAVLWALFFLIPIGRAQADHALSAGHIESVLHWAAALSRRAPFGIKTTEAPHYVRVLSSLAVDSAAIAHPRAPHSRDLSSRPAVGAALAVDSRPVSRGVGRASRAVTDGNGFVFIDHVGNICPSGFLPLTAGNVRRDDLVTVYCEDALFLGLRDPSRLGGRCGRCEFRERCGGSRARAYALTGDPLAEDPGCAYEPGPVTAVAGGAGASDVEPRVTRENVMEALQTVLDPELGMSIVELGLVYGVTVNGGQVTVTMTLTAPGCPIHDSMEQWVRQAVSRVAGVSEVEVAITFDPPWTPERITLRPGTPG
jgi:AdoMet-dependent heme synthase